MPTWIQQTTILRKIKVYPAVSKLIVGIKYILLNGPSVVGYVGTYWSIFHTLTVLIIESRHLISNNVAFSTSVDTDEPVQPPFKLGTPNVVRSVA